MVALFREWERGCIVRKIRLKDAGSFAASVRSSSTMCVDISFGVQKIGLFTMARLYVIWKSDGSSPI